MSQKKLYLIGGTMGVGKTAVCRYMKQKLDNSVFLDGDWCWDAHPFQMTEETKCMVMQNICFLLKQFIRCTVYEHIIFCWVMHEQSIIDEILGNLDQEACEIEIISLMCSPEVLKKRLKKDIRNGIRTEDIIERSVKRLPLYEKLNSRKIDTDSKSVQNIVEEMLRFE